MSGQVRIRVPPLETAELAVGDLYLKLISSFANFLVRNRQFPGNVSRDRAGQSVVFNSFLNFFLYFFVHRNKQGPWILRLGHLSDSPGRANPPEAESIR